ncbi:PCRF domain-containing protein, partial [Marinobacter salarius]|uniref:PCRF domain-containing protein n=1 Tax=Marinobacter salarius TaxID=1420917 RepID=UPI0022B14A87
PKMKQEISELEEQSANPDFWNDMENSQKVLQKIKMLKENVQRFERLQQKWEDLQTLVELGREEEDSSVLDEVSSEFAQL